MDGTCHGCRTSLASIELIDMGRVMAMPGKLDGVQCLGEKRL